MKLPKFLINSNELKSGLSSAEFYSEDFNWHNMIKLCLYALIVFAFSLVIFFSIFCFMRRLKRDTLNPFLNSMEYSMMDKSIL